MLGDPVCAQADKPALANLFHQFCRQNELGVVYIIASEEFANWTADNLSSALIEFGEKLILDPQRDYMRESGHMARLLRKNVNHAAKHGVIVSEYTVTNPELENSIQVFATSWQKNRKGPQVYLNDLSVFDDRIGRRWFYAQHEGNIIGLLTLSEHQIKNGWMVNDILTERGSLNGSSELLLVSTLSALSKEGFRSLTVGPVPLERLGEIRGLNNLAETITRWIYLLPKIAFNLGGRKTFWHKFQPRTERCFLVFPDRNLSYSSVKAILKALNSSI